MGNKPTHFTGSEPAELGNSKSLQTIFSEEDYLPMPRSMKESLLNGRKCQRVVPGVITMHAHIMERHDEIKMDPDEAFNKENVGKEAHEQNSLHKNSQILKNFNLPYSYPFDNTICYQNPVVTVVNRSKINSKSKSLPNHQIDGEHNIDTCSLDSCLRKSLFTNRQYSLIDLNTGLGKSEFTLELEDKLRKSKRVLGFDKHLSDWREFSFKVMSTTSSRCWKKQFKNDVNAKPMNSLVNKQKDVLKESNASVEYCTQNCQVLGLCSVKNPQVFPKEIQHKPLVLIDDIGKRSSTSRMLGTHQTDKLCHCDVCTLDFLTDINYHVAGTTRLSHRSENSVSNSEKNKRPSTKNIRIMNRRNDRKCIDVSVQNPTPKKRVSLISSSSNSTSKPSHDFTNARIRSMFEKSDPPEVREIYTNPNSSYREISIEKLPSELRACSSQSSVGTSLANKSPARKLSQRSSRNKYFQPSSTRSPSFASSSSLSTILSYKRVRRIFQTIIEGKRTKRHTKMEIMKFKEMEELGLGRLKNNRWCPSDYKTLSIWRDMNENVQGLKGEFRKFHKTISTP